jgi:hypothetical protein
MPAREELPRLWGCLSQRWKSLGNVCLHCPTPAALPGLRPLHVCNGGFAFTAAPVRGSGVAARPALFVLDIMFSLLIRVLLRSSGLAAARRIAWTDRGGEKRVGRA